MKSTGQRVLVDSFEEGKQTGRITLSVAVRAEYNFLIFERLVVGVDPDDLEPSDLPGPDEQVGALLTDPEEITQYCQLARDYNAGKGD